MIIYNNNIVEYQGNIINFTPPPIYHVYTSGNHGVVNAIPISGISGTEVTLTNTPEIGYSFDSYSVTGATLKNDNQFNIVNSDVYVHGNFIDPYNPLNLPPFTIRVRTRDGEVPFKHYDAKYETATRVPGTTDVYDVYKGDPNWFRILYASYNVSEVLGANTTGVTNMYQMFESCGSLTTVPLFDTSSVTDMTYMFWDCASLTSVALFDTSNVTTMLGMFCECDSLTTVPLFDTHNVTNMHQMFMYCPLLTSVPLFDTINVTDMGYMFHECDSLTTVPLFDTRNVTDMEYMFYDCDSLTTLPLFNTHNVSETTEMCIGCSALTAIPLFDTTNMDHMNYMFDGCINVQTGALALFQQASTQANPPNYHMDTFRECGINTITGAAELEQIGYTWR